MFTARKILRAPHAARRLIAIASVLGAILVPAVAVAAPPTAAPPAMHDARVIPPSDTDEGAKVWTATTDSEKAWRKYYADKKAAEKRAEKKAAEKKAAEKNAAKKAAAKKAYQNQAAKKAYQKQVAKKAYYKKSR